MSTNDTENVSYRIGEETHRIIKQDIVEFEDIDLNSAADFTRRAINNQTSVIQEIAQGGWIAKRLLSHLTKIRGIQENIPDQAVSTALINDNRDKPLSIQLDKKQRGQLNVIADNSELSQSQAIQYSLVKELAEISESGILLGDRQERSVIRFWVELKDGLDEPKLRLHHVLTKRFVLNYEMTVYLIREDPEPFKDFAEAYTDDFHGSDLYEDLEDLYGRETLRDVENVIEEETDYRIDRLEDEGNETSFLSEELSEIEDR